MPHKCLMAQTLKDPTPISLYAEPVGQNFGTNSRRANYSLIKYYYIFIEKCAPIGVGTENSRTQYNPEILYFPNILYSNYFMCNEKS